MFERHVKVTFSQTRYRGCQLIQTTLDAQPRNTRVTRAWHGGLARWRKDGPSTRQAVLHQRSSSLRFLSSLFSSQFSFIRKFTPRASGAFQILSLLMISTSVPLHQVVFMYGFNSYKSWKMRPSMVLVPLRNFCKTSMEQVLQSFRETQLRVPVATDGDTNKASSNQL